MRATLALAAFFVVVVAPRDGEAGRFRCYQALGNDTRLLQLIGDAGRHLDIPGDPAGACHIAIFEGPIEGNDGKRGVAFLRAQTAYLDEIYLNTPGGSGQDAIIIGQEIRRLLLVTVAPYWRADDVGYFRDYRGYAICMSACFFLYAAGVERTGEFVGVHQPRPADRYMREVRIPDMKSWLANVAEDVRRYLRSMDVNDKYVDIMMRTPHEDIRMLTENELRVDFRRPNLPTVVAYSTKCGTPLSSIESQRLHTLISMDLSRLTYDQSAEYVELRARAQNYPTCTALFRLVHRARLAKR
jgi:hypothetical protein